MDTISQIQVNDIVYEICDVQTRNDITLLQETIDNFLYERFWRPAGTISITYSGAGYVTTSSKEVIFTAPINNGAIDINKNPTITWDAANSFAAIRYNDKYLWGSSSGRAALTGLTLETPTISQNQLIIVLIKSSAYSNATNNAPVGVDVRMNGTLSYNPMSQ